MLILIPLLYIAEHPWTLWCLLTIWAISGALCVTAYFKRKRKRHRALVYWVASLIGPIAVLLLSFLAASVAPKGMEPWSGPNIDVMFLGIFIGVDLAILLTLVSIVVSFWTACIRDKEAQPGATDNPTPHKEVLRTSTQSIASPG